MRHAVVSAALSAILAAPSFADELTIKVPIEAKNLPAGVISVFANCVTHLEGQPGAPDIKFVDSEAIPRKPDGTATGEVTIKITNWDPSKRGYYCNLMANLKGANGLGVKTNFLLPADQRFQSTQYPEIRAKTGTLLVKGIIQ